jgi:hypothetical protein
LYQVKNKSRYFFLYFSLIVYVVSVTGVTINKHFCEGELESVTLIEKSTCCEGETEDEPDGCCSNETIYLANHSETIISAEKISLDPGAQVLYCKNLISSFAFNLSGLPATVFNRINKRPPALHNEELSKLMVFRI